MFSRRVRLIWALILVAGCAVYSRHELDERFGPADPARYDRVPVGDPSVDFWRDVKPVLDSRCVVCHGCYDAPCQLQTTSYEGVTRGANKDTVYDSARLMAASRAACSSMPRATRNGARRDFTRCSTSASRRHKPIARIACSTECWR